MLLQDRQVGISDLALLISSSSENKIIFSNQSKDNNDLLGCLPRPNESRKLQVLDWARLDRASSTNTFGSGIIKITMLK